MNVSEIKYNFEFEQSALDIINSKANEAFLQGKEIFGDLDFSDYESVRDVFKKKISTVKGQEKIFLNLVREYTSFRKKNLKRFEPFEPLEFETSLLVIAKMRSHLEVLLNMASVNDRDKFGRPVLYIASVCGYRKIVILLLKKGAHPYFTSPVPKSTPLHGAAFYGHYKISKFLSELGADFSIKNEYGLSPYQEASSEIKSLMTKYKDDLCYKLFQNFRFFMQSVKLIFKENEYVGRRLQLSEDPSLCKWQVCWHGTKLAAVESILKHGLKKVGSNLGLIIKRRDQSRERSSRREPNKEESSDIFTSPSILYASDSCYAEHFKDIENNTWTVLLECRLKPDSFKKRPGTIKDYKKIKDEPESLEFSVDSEANVRVSALWFLRLDFLKQQNNYGKLNSFLLNYFDFYDEEFFFTDFTSKFKNIFQFLNRVDKVFDRNEPSLSKSFFGRRFLLKDVPGEVWSWNLSWHGSKLEYTQSILENGLKKPGEKTKAGEEIRIREKDGRIPLNAKVHGVEKWAEAIFTSPSIFYSSAENYAESFINSKTQAKWVLLFECRVKPGTYFEGPHTFLNYQPRAGEPVNVEFRSVETKNVRVIALWLIKREFLDKQKDFDYLMLILKSYMVR